MIRWLITLITEEFMCNPLLNAQWMGAKLVPSHYHLYKFEYPFLQNIAAIFARVVRARGHRTVWNELIESSTFKKLYQSINYTKYHIVTVPTNPLSCVWHIPNKTAQPSYICTCVRSQRRLVLKWHKPSLELMYWSPTFIDISKDWLVVGRYAITNNSVLAALSFDRFHFILARIK